jgi:glycosyltransferase involved in cell wall biosynthesis
MKAVFITSTFDHYHVSSCQEAYRQLGDGFTFIATKPMPDSMKKLGFTDFSKVYPYVLNAYESPENEKKAVSLCSEADVVIIGAAPAYYVEERLKADKITFRFSERLFKKGYLSLLKPKNAAHLYKTVTRYRKNKNLFVLCAGFYAAKDYHFIGVHKDKLLRWAYFSAVKPLDREYSTDVVRILWTGRFVKLKHPEYALAAACKLRDSGIRFELNFIGMGPMEQVMQDYIREHKLEDSVHILGSMPTEQVQKYMDNADISLFTSDRREGWGAVVNEAMVGGCAVVASDAAGSSKSLITSGENGIVFPFKDKNYFIDAVLMLAKDADLRKAMGIKANETLYREWNGEVAMARLLEISRAIIAGDVVPEYQSGPCSKPI